jgi:GT2 family glycosyltransferase
MSVVGRMIRLVDWVVPWNRTESAPQCRVKQDGKLLVRRHRRLRIHGCTYGPFAPNAAGELLPSADRVAEDFARMRDAGFNSLRLYSIPPDWFLDLADSEELTVLVDVPWPRHVCFLDSRQARSEARQIVRRAAERGRGHSCVLAYSIGNEIPANIVRWHGAARVERFLRELMDVARQADPGPLVTYANYPPTEYLDLSFLDFATFNVYLHDRTTFRRYLFRLQNRVGDRPLVLGELGMDTLRHSSLEQAEFLGGHVREALLMGLAGAYVFSWTDEWHTGGYRIEDWAFGVTDTDRSPKPSYHALREVFERTPAELLLQTPRVSVVVCSYNGGRTLDQCLRSLLALDYPNYEVIVVDDGSTDNTGAILARFPEVRAIRQPNLGLSSARNAGLRAATGGIIAYTDSDCYADADWLTHLVHQLQRTDAVAVGGPNLSPDDGWVAACVGCCPGQPTHVLESDQVAEHIPGCNMAFRREALEAINSFDPCFHTAGDDVDVCWRLQQSGYWITFAPGAFVWHHRRQTPRTYLRQQAGYGQAEALLQFKHPDKFTDRGHGKWRGVLYGPSVQGLRFAEQIIYRGVFGTSSFQCVYRPGPVHWTTLPSTLEWNLLMLLGGLVALWYPLFGLGAAVLFALSVTVAVLQALQARLPPAYDGISARLLMAGLSFAQPQVRSWHRYRTRVFSRPPVVAPLSPATEHRHRVGLRGVRTVAYWSEDGCRRMDLLRHFLAYLTEHRWGKTVDSGWSDWDIQIHGHPWTIVCICTAEEEHGGGRCLIRVRFRVRPSALAKMLHGAALLSAALAVLLTSWAMTCLAGGCLAVYGVVWWLGTRRASRVVEGFEHSLEGLNLVRC